MKVGLFLPNWIGDVVMATPALLALRKHFRNDELIGIYHPYVAGVLEGFPWFDRTIEVPPKRGLLRGSWKLAQEIRKQSLDLALLFTNSFRTAFAAWMGRAKQRIGFARDNRSWLLTSRLESLREEGGKFKPNPVIDCYNLLAEAAGAKSPGHQMRLFTTLTDQHHAHEVWKKFKLVSPVVLLNPGAAYGSAKHWPVEHFVSLARRLVQVNKANVLVLCGPGERELARSIAAQSRSESVHSLADEEVNLGLLKACVKQADLLITTDSGPRHFAAAFDTPVVTLFGPTHIEWTETYFPQAKHLQKKLPCGPCQKRVCPLQGSNHHRCMRELLPLEVFHAASALLQHRQGGPAEPPPPMRRAS